MLYEGFVLIFYFEASSSYFILRFRPHSSSLFYIEAMFLSLRLWSSLL